MLATFRKQNLNFIEILFTPYAWVNPLFESEWGRLTAAREQIAHYSPYSAVKTMKGIAMEKYHAMEHEYPSKLEVLAEYGYNPKQLHHLLRVQEYIHRYIADVIKTADTFCEKVGKTFDTEVDELLDDVQYNIVKSALKGEILSD